MAVDSFIRINEYENRVHVSILQYTYTTFSSVKLERRDLGVYWVLNNRV